MPKIYIPHDSPFLTADTRKRRWAVPYDHDCLNARIEVLLDRQRDAIAGQTLLDVGSHMGTFAYAALMLGAERVHGIDAESRMVELGRKLFESQNVHPSSYRFETQDIFEFLEQVPENSYDTVLCFGVLYYTADPFRLLQLMKRAARRTDAVEVYKKIKDETLDLPLQIVSLTQPLKKDYKLPQSFNRRGKELSLMTLPTRSLLEIWFESLELNMQMMDWSDFITRDVAYHDLFTPEQKQASHWADIYSSEVRVSYRLSVSDSL
jgi:predicted RNA methylase